MSFSKIFLKRKIIRYYTLIIFVRTNNRSGMLRTTVLIHLADKILVCDSQEHFVVRFKKIGIKIPIKKRYDL